jgi:hypothetical protein
MRQLEKAAALGVGSDRELIRAGAHLADCSDFPPSFVREDPKLGAGSAVLNPLVNVSDQYRSPESAVAEYNQQRLAAPDSRLPGNNRSDKSWSKA